MIPPVVVLMMTGLFMPSVVVPGSGESDRFEISRLLCLSAPDWSKVTDGICISAAN